MLRKTRAALAAVAALGLVHCSDGPTQVSQGGGGGSEAVALTGAVRNPDQTPALGARVRLRPRLYLTDTGATANPRPEDLTLADVATNDSGAFRIDSLEPGEYVIEIRDTAGMAVRMPFTVTGLTPKLDLGTTLLKATGSVTGVFVSPDGIKGRTWVQVYGLERLALADSTGRFRMDSLPEGTYTLRALNSAPAVNPLDVDAVPAKPSLSTDIGAVKLGSFELENYALWPQYMRIYLNTTASGADVPGMVADFPLLVRLDSSNFDFSRARGDGRDIRFSDHRGKRLRYQVERWDSAGSRAEIWVRTEVIQGNSADQFITLHWGRSDAMDWSDGRAVFERDYGYAGVWHFAEDGAGTSDDRYADALGINPADDRASSSDRQGLSGAGAGFDGDDYVQVPVADPVLKPLGRLTVSAWIKPTAKGSQGGGILSMGDNYNLRVSTGGGARFSLFDGASRAIESSGNLLDGNWHHVAGVFDGSALVLYVDGAEKARMATTAPVRYNKSPNFVIGRHGNGKSGFDFTGSLDEVTVLSESRSADWIRLAFESQRQGSRLLEFLP
jgi:hypothetical protein